MARDMMPAGNKRCYACIQWEGTRTYLREKKQIKVDPHDSGNCLVFKIKKLGSGSCEHMEPLK